MRGVVLVLDLVLDTFQQAGASRVHRQCEPEYFIAPSRRVVPHAGLPVMAVTAINKTGFGWYSRGFSAKVLGMSSAVQSLQKAVVAGNQPLTQVLRQAKLMAAKLGVGDVEAWVDSELNGYSDGSEPPIYREFATQAIQIRNPVRGWEFAGHLHIRMKARQPIADHCHPVLAEVADCKC